MSINQWKLLNQIREYISKLNDKSSQATIQKELQYIARRIPHLQKDVLRYFDYGERTENVAENKDEVVVKQPPQQQQQQSSVSRYNLPNVLETLKKKNDAADVPRWKTTTTAVISKVRLG